MEAKKKLVMPAAIVTAVFLGVAASSALIAMRANAQTATTTTPTTSSATDPVGAADTDKVQDETVAHHTGTNGVKEELLTGDTAEKVKAAALVANPGGTIQRVENDAEGAAYEAHMTKSDSSRVTVKLDKDFKVTATEAGGGPGHRM